MLILLLTFQSLKISYKNIFPNARLPNDFRFNNINISLIKL